jgi:hypothetical protein
MESSSNPEALETNYDVHFTTKLSVYTNILLGLQIINDKVKRFVSVHRVCYYTFTILSKLMHITYKY